MGGQYEFIARDVAARTERCYRDARRQAQESEQHDGHDLLQHAVLGSLGIADARQLTELG